MKIQESAENYLETILILSLKKSYVRSIDIANELGFSKPVSYTHLDVYKRQGLPDGFLPDKHIPSILQNFLLHESS